MTRTITFTCPFVLISERCIKSGGTESNNHAIKGTFADGRIVLRGNLDPSSAFRFGTPDQIAAQTRALMRDIDGAPWIVSSGCDIPPGTPEENLAAFAEAVRVPLLITLAAMR